MTCFRFESHLIENCEVRIFLSSTFSDMDMERTALVRLFHKLRLEANKRCASLSLIDLRWGVTSEESRTGKVLSVCLNEIENSHPFFIGLLGNRYGFTPEASELRKNPDLLERYPWIGDDISSGMSITEIEMQYGALRNQEDVDAAFFIKDDDGVPPDDNVRLTALKAKIRAQKRFPVYGFDSTNQLCDNVEKMVMGLLNKYFSDQDNTRLGRERTIQQAYINSRHRFYVPQQEAFDRLDNFLDSDERFLVLTGESGTGKSALIANWLKALGSKPNVGYNVISHFVGNSLGGNDYQEVLQHISDEIFEFYDGLEVRMGNYESHEEKTQRYMTEAVQKGDRPMLIVIDGINQIDGHDQAKLINWLPLSSKKVKYLFSTLSDDETMETFIRRGYPVYTVEPLKDREKFISNYLSLVGKKLDESQTVRILHSKNTENTLVLKTLLDELICFGSYNLFDQRIDFYLAAGSIPDFFTRVLQRLENDYGCARQVLSLIAVSEYGLSEDELLLMTGVRQIDFHLFFCAVSSHLTSVGWLLVFSHQYVTDAVWSHYDLAQPAASRPYREEIIRYFSRNDAEKDYRQMSELAFQYYHINDTENLYKTVMSFGAFGYFSSTTSGCIRLASYWHKLRDMGEGKYRLRDYLDLPYENIPLIDLPYLHLGRFFQIYFGDSDTALMYDKTFLMMAQMYGERYSPVVGTCYNDVGSLYLAKGDYGQALEYLEQAMEIRENSLGTTDSALATTYNNLGLVYENIGNYDKATEFLRKAKDICMEVYGKDNPKTASSLDNLGLAYRGKEDFDMALQCHLGAARVFENVLGPEHPDTASSYNNAGLAFEKIGQYDKAMDYHQRALAVRMMILGPDHPDTSYSLVNIGCVYHKQKDFEQALKCYFKALRIQEKALGQKHPLVAVTYSRIGASYDQKEEYGKALDFYQKALSIREEVLGEHIVTADTYYDIACVYGFLDNHKQAMKYHLNALEIREKKLPKDHYDLGRSYNNLGNAYLLEGDSEQALSYYLRAVGILEKSLTPAHKDTVTTYCNVANAYIRIGEIGRAVEWFQKAADQGDEESKMVLELLEHSGLPNQDFQGD